MKAEFAKEILEQLRDLTASGVAEDENLATVVRAISDCGDADADMKIDVLKQIALKIQETKEHIVCELGRLIATLQVDEE